MQPGLELDLKLLKYGSIAITRLVGNRKVRYWIKCSRDSEKHAKQIFHEFQDSLSIPKKAAEYNAFVERLDG